MKKLLKPLIPEFVFRARRRRQLVQLGIRNGISVRFTREFIELSKGDSVLRLGCEQGTYSEDCISCFDYYFDSVVAPRMGGRYLADFSTPRFHKLTGFDHFPVLIPSIPEPYITIEQYLSFAQLKPGDIVFDLGVYAGITTIVFSQKVGVDGAVFGFEADNVNFGTASENLRTARHFGAPNNILLVEKQSGLMAMGLNFQARELWVPAQRRL